MNTLLRICSLTLCAVLGSGCASYVGSGAIHEIRCPVGTSRAQIIATLGQPRQSRRFVPAVEYGHFFPDARGPLRQALVGVYDEYRVSGLTVATRNPYKGVGFAEGEGIAAGASFGLTELILIPMAAIDLAARPFERHPIRLWYDPSEHLIDCDDGPKVQEVLGNR